MLKKITKRDQQFGSKIKDLPGDWCDYSPFLILENRAHGLAEFWKFIICQQQRDAARSLYFANSNQHILVGHKVTKEAGSLVFSSQVVLKAYYLRYCILLLQSCGDKLAQMVRVALNIKEWSRGQDKEPLAASEETTKLTTLKTHLQLTEAEPRLLFNIINAYLKDDSVKIIVFQLANEIKHKWTTTYKGEGYFPIKNPILEERDAEGKLVKEQISIGMSLGVNIDDHIRHALVTNNLFVEMATRISELLRQELLRKKTKWSK